MVFLSLFFSLSLFIDAANKPRYTGFGPLKVELSPELLYAYRYILVAFTDNLATEGINWWWLSGFRPGDSLSTTIAVPVMIVQSHSTLFIPNA